MQCRCLAIIHCREGSVALIAGLVIYDFLKQVHLEMTTVLRFALLSVSVILLLHLYSGIQVVLTLMFCVSQRAIFVLGIATDGIAQLIYFLFESVLFYCHSLIF